VQRKVLFEPPRPPTGPATEVGTNPRPPGATPDVGPDGAGRGLRDHLSIPLDGVLPVTTQRESIPPDFAQTGVARALASPRDPVHTHRGSRGHQRAVGSPAEAEIPWANHLATGSSAPNKRTMGR